jgi:C4-dicarboxylate-specific signal transduction histidine kinase
LSLCTEKFKNKDIIVDVEIADELEVFCHHGLISHAITNVLDNAYDAIEKTDDKWIRIRSRKNKNNILLTITDNGKGIGSNVAKNMMNPFYTTKGVGVGMGLGLSLASSTMKKHGGRLYYNTKSTNTQFVLEFPILQSI